MSSKFKLFLYACFGLLFLAVSGVFYFIYQLRTSPDFALSLIAEREAIEVNDVKKLQAATTPVAQEALIREHEQNCRLVEAKMLGVVLVASRAEGSAAILCELIKLDGLKPEAADYMKILADQYADSRFAFLADLSRQPFLESPAFTEMLTAFRNKSPLPRTRAMATLRLAKIASTAKSAGERSQAKTLFAEASSRYGALPFDRHKGLTIADEARRNLFEIEHLALGMVAPTLVGKDVYGQTLDLKDFRGRVVLLDFFGYW